MSITRVSMYSMVITISFLQLKVILFQWVALVMTVTVLSEERPKRDLLLIKKMMGALLGPSKITQSEEHSKYYNIPGQDNILLKVTPKHAVQETEVPEKTMSEPVDLTVSIIRSYLGTNTHNKTVEVLKQVKNLVNLGIFNGKENEQIQEVIVPLTLPNTIYTTKEENDLYSIEFPNSITLRKPGYESPYNIISYGPFTGRGSVNIEVPPEPIESTHVKVSEIFRPTYSYKQTAQDGSVTTFKSEGDENIIVTETEVIPPLPWYIKFRLEEVAAKCINKIPCSRPLSQVPVFSSNTPEFTITDYLVGGDDSELITLKEGNPIFKKTTVTMLQKQGSKGVSVNVIKSRSHEINGNKSSNESRQMETNLNTNMINSAPEKSSKSQVYNKYKLGNEQTDSQFSHKLIKHIVPLRDEIKTKLVDLRNDEIKLPEEPYIIPSNYLYVSPLTENVSLNKLTNTNTKDNQEVANIQNLLINRQKTNLDKTIIRELEKSKAKYSLIDHPIIVEDDTPFVYKQIKHGGSVITTRGNFENISVESSKNEANYNISDVIF